MIFDFFRNGFSIDMLVNLLARVFVMFCVLPIHEFAHALVAHKLGDETARLSGRLTVNPLAHLDIFGSILILVAGFGYAKPVPVNVNNFKNRKVGMALTAVAGPFSNLIMAFVFMLCFCAIGRYTDMVEGSVAWAIGYFFFYACSVNISLAVFNFVPIPPLDGSRILELFIPERYLFKFMRYERYFVFIVFAVIMMGWLDPVIGGVSSVITKGLFSVGAAVFGLN